jgi:Rod binding domain-containing protein
MTDLSTQVLPYNLLSPTTQAPKVGSGESKAQIAKTADSFETSFLSNMLGQMFEGVSTEGPFGGGQGEAAFRSFMMDAFAQQITKSGGIGVAASVQKEMLKMQGLS